MSLHVAVDVSETVVEVDDRLLGRAPRGGIRGTAHGCSGRAAQALRRASGGVLACSASSALTVNVGGGQVSWSTLRARPRMFCYCTFTQPCSVTRDRSGSRISSTVLAHACHGTCGRV